MIIDCYSTDDFALNYIAKNTDDEIVKVDDVLQSGAKELFSEKPYVLVMDYANIFSAKAIAKFFKIKFTGSKILYCVFTAPEYKSVYSETARIITSVKRFILFGSCVSGDRLPDFEKYVENLHEISSAVKNCSPQNNVANLSFPFRTADKKV